jgi:nicotinamide-nucleotide amidase
MALNVLRKTPEAQWSVAVVGHLGPDAPTEKDGQIFYSCTRRTKKDNLKVTDSAEYVCKSKDRVARQEEATEAVLTNFARVLHKKSQADAPQNGEVPKSKGKKKKKQTV